MDDITVVVATVQDDGEGGGGVKKTAGVGGVKSKL